MKTILLLEDTPRGITAECRWQTNDCNDNIEQSIAMNTMSNLTLVLKRLAAIGAVKVHLEEEMNDQRSRS